MDSASKDANDNLGIIIVVGIAAWLLSNIVWAVAVVKVLTTNGT